MYERCWEVNTAICEMAIKQRFSVSCTQMFKERTVCYCQIHMGFGLNKLYNQNLSELQLLSPQLKIQRQGSTNIPVIISMLKKKIIL